MIGYSVRIGGKNMADLQKYIQEQGIHRLMISLGLENSARLHVG